VEDWVYQAWRNMQNKLALVVDDMELSFQEVNIFSSKIAEYLQLKYSNSHIGLIPNDMKNSILMIYALLKSGHNYTIFNNRLSVKELTEQIKFAIPDVILTNINFDFYNIITFDQIESEIKNLSGEQFKQSYISLSNSFIQLFTSGSSGQIKLVRHNYSNVMYNAIGSVFRLGHSKEDRWLLTIPIYHVGGLSIIFRCLINNIPLVTTNRKYSTENLTSLISRQKITIVSLVPSMLQSLISDTPNIDILRQLRVILLGGAKASKNLLETCVKNSLNVFATYGLTETFAQVVTSNNLQNESSLIISGSPLFGVELFIQLENQGKIGEIWIRSPSNFIEYYNNKSLTEQVIEDGWIKTGDFGYIDENENLVVLNRKDDLIISGGENIYPSQVEDILCNYQYITEIQVFGVPDDQWGEKVVAAIIPKIYFNENDFLSFAREHIGRYKIPKQLFYFDSFPTLSSGKIIRSQLKSIILEKLHKEKQSSVR
jgi:o-succinylbenzoate---CoA ligase